MKIAFLTPEFPHPKMVSAGGIGTSILNLSKGLIGLGHEVSILVYGQKDDAFFVENDISFYIIKNIKLTGFSNLEDADSYAKFLTNNLPLMLFETDVIH